MTQKFRARGFTITINNDKFDDLEQLLDLEFKYLIFGFEVGKNKTRHIQGYVYFDNAISFNSLKKQLPRAHLEIARGSPVENFNYCSKDDDFYEFGERPEQGKRNDLENIKSKLDSGVKLKHIADEHFGDFVRYYKGFDRYNELNPSLNNNTQVIYKKYESIDWNKIDIENTLCVSREAQLASYDNHECIIFMKPSKFDTYQLWLLEKNLPYTYKAKQIKPKQVILVG